MYQRIRSGASNKRLVRRAGNETRIAWYMALIWSSPGVGVPMVSPWEKRVCRCFEVLVGTKREVVGGGVAYQVEQLGWEGY